MARPAACNMNSELAGFNRGASKKLGITKRKKEKKKKKKGKQSKKTQNTNSPGRVAPWALGRAPPERGRARAFCGTFVLPPAGVPRMPVA